MIMGSKIDYLMQDAVNAKIKSMTVAEKELMLFSELMSYLDRTTTDTMETIEEWLKEEKGY
tara:strand:+ start:187 stop:369 length:183 start_codon:yes stop_codon:yes gene_type:complete